MTLPTEVKELIRRRYGNIAARRMGKKKLLNTLEKDSPGICIEDAMLRIHSVSSYRSLEKFAEARRRKMARMACFAQETPELAEKFRKRGIRIDLREPLWFDIFLWLMANVEHFFASADHANFYVMTLDRGTPPAKYLKHIERYSSKEKSIPPQYVVQTTADALKILRSDATVPRGIEHYMKQKAFVDALIQHLGVDLIPEFYHAPPGKMFILDGPKQNSYPIAWNGPTRGDLTSPIYRNHCLESDIGIIFWCNVFKAKDILVVTADGDVLLALLLYTRYRISSIDFDTSASNGNGSDKNNNNNGTHGGGIPHNKTPTFTFRNTIYLEAESKSVPENTDEIMEASYISLCEQHALNELNGGPESGAKAAYLDKLRERIRSQEQVLDFMMGTDRPPTNAKALGTLQSNAASINLEDDSEQKTAARKNSKNMTYDDQPIGNAQMHKDYDVLYLPEGTKLYQYAEFFNINELYQCIYLDVMSKHDPRMTPLMSPAFAPIENFVAACKLCGDDYVKKPNGIGEKFILESFFKCMNNNGNLVYIKQVNTDRHANYASTGRIMSTTAVTRKRSKLEKRNSRGTNILMGSGGTNSLTGSRGIDKHDASASCTATSSDDSDEFDANDNGNDDNNNTLGIVGMKRKPAADVAAEVRERLVSSYSHYLQIIVDPKAILQLVKNAFIIKKSKNASVNPEAVAVICGNLRYSCSYFANDFKMGTTGTDCFDVHEKPDGCGHSIYGYKLIDPHQAASRTNICRAETICNCFMDEIRRHFEREMKKLADSN